MTQQGDIVLFQTPDDGDICVTDGMVLMSGGLETSAYLALFGGNEDDAGDTNLQFWGNYSENEPSKKYTSEFQYLLNKLPPISANLLLLEASALRDLNYMITEKIANSITVFASIPDINKINVLITIEANGLESSFNFTENWKAAL